MCAHTHTQSHSHFFFDQFIDGRLDLLNSGEGFSDVFEEEINMGEYAGEKSSVSGLLCGLWATDGGGYTKG